VPANRGAHSADRFPRWAFEVKHDGYRFIARDGERVRIFPRRGRDWTDKVRLIVEAVLVLPVKSAAAVGTCGERPARLGLPLRLRPAPAGTREKSVAPL